MSKEEMPSEKRMDYDCSIKFLINVLQHKEEPSRFAFLINHEQVEDREIAIPSTVMAQLPERLKDYIGSVSKKAMLPPHKDIENDSHS